MRDHAVAKARFADRASREPAWVALHAAGDARIPPMSQWLQQALAQFADGIGTRSLRAVAEGQHTVLTERLVTLGDDLARPVDLLASAFDEGGTIGIAQVPGAVAAAAVRKQLAAAFDVARPEALAWVQQHAGALIRHLQDGVGDTVRALTARALQDGRTVQQLARDLRAMSPVLGLDRGSAVAVDNLRRRLVAEGRTAAMVDRTTAAYAERLLRRRAMSIARTEVLTALNEGQREAWRQARRTGHLRSLSKRTWIVTPDDRLCPRCAPQDDLTADIGGRYTLRFPVSGTTSGPPLHVDCRCAEGLVA